MGPRRGGERGKGGRWRWEAGRGLALVAASPVGVGQSVRGSPDEEVTVALIGGQRLLRDATASLLASEDGLRMLGTFESADHFLQAGIEEPPAVLLLDCDEDDPACWRKAIGKLELGVCAVQRRDALRGDARRGDPLRARAARERGHSEELPDATDTRVDRLYRDGAYGHARRLAAGVYQGWKKPLGLSPRHRQILALMAQGQGNDEIATELELSPNTVKFHIRALYSRLGVHNRVEAANRYAQMPSGDG